MNAQTGSTESGREWLQARFRRDGESSLRVDVHVRSLAPGFGVRQRQEAVMDRLRTLADRDVLDDVTLSVWGDGICVDGACAETTACRRVLDRIERFRSWAANCDRPVDLGFERRSVSSAVLEDSYEEVVPPEVCLAVYADDVLAFVLPCTVAGDHVSASAVFDMLDRQQVDAVGEV